MNILMVARISGTRNGVDWSAPGETIDLPDDEAAQLIRAGLGLLAPELEDVDEAEGADEAAEPEPGPETAIADAGDVETAVAPRPKRTAKPKV